MTLSTERWWQIVDNRTGQARIHRHVPGTQESAERQIRPWVDRDAAGGRQDITETSSPSSWPSKAAPERCDVTCNETVYRTIYIPPTTTIGEPMITTTILAAWRASDRHDQYAHAMGVRLSEDCPNYVLQCRCECGMLRGYELDHLASDVGELLLDNLCTTCVADATTFV